MKVHTNIKDIIIKSIMLICTFLLALESTRGQVRTSASGGRDLWAEMMFNDMGTQRTHDFGSVALHAEVEHHFQFRNIYKEDVVIQSVTSNCGCTKPSASKTVVRSMETAEIIARVDTSGKEHTKRRKATVTVIFSKPTYAEVQLQVTTYIRSDVLFNPGVVEFGTVPLGSSITKTVYLQYEGSNQWALTGLKKSDPAFRAEAQEVERQNGHVVYKIDVTLKQDANPGYLNDLLHFTTNDVNTTTASVFLPIHGVIMEPLSAKPSFFQMGIIQPGHKVSKNLVVRSSTPFTIKKIHCEDPRMSFLIANRKSTIHVIPISFLADTQEGGFSDNITIYTDQMGLNPLDVSISGYVSKEEDSNFNMGIPQSQVVQKSKTELPEKKPKAKSSPLLGESNTTKKSDTSPKRDNDKKISERNSTPSLNKQTEKGPVPLQIEHTDDNTQKTPDFKQYPLAEMLNNQNKVTDQKTKPQLSFLNPPTDDILPKTVKETVTEKTSQWRTVGSQPTVSRKSSPLSSTQNEITRISVQKPIQNEITNNKSVSVNEVQVNGGILFRRPTKVATNPGYSVIRK